MSQKIHASPSAKPSTFLLDERALHKDNFATGNGELHFCPNSLLVMWSAKRTFFFQRHFNTSSTSDENGRTIES